MGTISLSTYKIISEKLLGLYTLCDTDINSKKKKKLKITFIKTIVRVYEKYMCQRSKCKTIILGELRDYFMTKVFV